MSTSDNKPMLSVERDAFEAFWRATMNVEVMDLHRCEFPMTAYNDQPYACHETDRAWMTWKGRALLDKPVFESQYAGMTQEQAQAVSDGVDKILHGEPAAHKQPAPVYQVCDGVNGWIDVDLLRYTACCLDPEEYECRVLYAEQPAPVAVVMPERMKDTQQDYSYVRFKEGYNAALETVARLNGVKP